MWSYNEKWAVCKPEKGSHQKLTMLAPQPQTSSLQNGEKQIHVVYNPPGLLYFGPNKDTASSS